MKKRYTTLWEMKQRLKALVAEIRAEKADGRRHTRSQFEFRHLHITRCLIKGRTIEQVEGSPDSHTRKGNPPDMKHVEALLAIYKPKHDAEVAEMKREFELVPVLARA